MARSLARGLAEEGYTVDVALDGADGLTRATTEPYDAIVLDDEDPHGLTVCPSETQDW